MRLRLLTGVVGAVVVVGAVWVGAPWLTLLALLGGGLAIVEAYQLTPPGVERMPAVLGVIAVAALVLASEASAGRDFHAAAGLALAAWAFAAILWFIACYNVKPQTTTETTIDEFADEEEREAQQPASPEVSGSVSGYSREYEVVWEYDNGEEFSGFDDEGWEHVDEGEESRGLGARPWLGFLFLLLAPVYVGFLLGHGLAMRDLGGDEDALGRSWLLFTLLVVFACDTGAYAVGRLLGRHRMAPRVSPNKTWEGAAGGFAASVGVALLAGVVFELGVPVWQQAVTGAVASVAAQIGDLAESALKRAANAKDSGRIMPGHGGILDRMDSILFALPAVFYMLLALGFRL